MNPVPLFRFRFHNRRHSPATGLLRFKPNSGYSAAMLPESAVPRGVLIFAVISVSCLLLYGAADSLRFLYSPSVSFPHIFPSRLGNNDSSSPPLPFVSIITPLLLPFSFFLALFY